MSHPVRVRGLKSDRQERRGKNESVAPRAGAWIEIRDIEFLIDKADVAPRAGAWIEI